MHLLNQLIHILTLLLNMWLHGMSSISAYASYLYPSFQNRNMWHKCNITLIFCFVCVCVCVCVCAREWHANHYAQMM